MYLEYQFYLFSVHIATLFLMFISSFQQSSQVSTDLNANNHVNKAEEKVGDGKSSSHSLDEVTGMIHSTLSAYESKVNALSCDGSNRRRMKKK